MAQGKKWGRQRGQALLMAVVLMVFVALLGATFITVVSNNLSSTARAESKANSQRAALAGLQFVDEQIVANGLRWRPKTDSPPPVPGDAAYRFYYDEFDRAQGWATTGVAPNDANYERDGFVKYPDPRASGESASPFMARVERVRAGDSENGDGTRTGMLRITVIGRDAENKAAYTRLVRYKNGTAQNALAGAMRTVTNWDFALGDVPRGEVLSAGGTTLVLQQMRGSFPQSGFSVMIGDPLTYASTGIMPRAVAVQNYDASSLTLTLASAPSPTPVAGERVEMCATLGAPNYINYDNSSTIGTASTTGEFAIFDVASLNAGNAQTATGVRVNGSLLWQGDVRAKGLQSPQVSGIAATLRASGLIQVQAAQTPVTAARTAMGTTQVTLAGAYRSDAGATHVLNTTTNPALLVSSTATNFPGAWTSSANVALTQSEKSQLADDGWNRLAGTPAATRSVESVVPPEIRAERWRALTQFAVPATGRAENSARFGYGKGIYIDNRADRERIGNGAAARDMTESEFRQMVFDDTTAAAFNRLGTPASPADAAKSLEEKHLRGWIGPDEFRARGVLIELNADATLTITRDSRDDAFPLGLSPAQAWRAENGILMGDATLGGVYSQRFLWPENGIIFAEGNVRVRGVANNPPRSLTVVSMGHIFIEGTTAIDTNNGTTRKLLLLARKNVVLNPTQVLSRIDEQTLLSSATAAGATQLPVFDATNFDVGCWIFLDNPATTNDPYAQIIGIDRPPGTSAGTLRLDRAITAQPAGRAVRSENDPLFKTSVGGSELNLVGTERVHIERFGQTVQRRFIADADETRVGWKHSAERRDALVVRYKPPSVGGDPEPAAANLGFKLATDANTSVLSSEQKWLAINDGTTDLDRFGIAALASGETTAGTYSLRWLGGDAGPTPAVRGRLRDARLAPNWRYADNSDASVLNNYLVDPTRIPPYFFLAAVGNRKAWTNTSTVTKPASTVWPFRELLKGGWATTGYKIPMATSIALHMNGFASNNTMPDGRLGIRNDVFSVGLGNYERVGQFGFNPRHGLEDGTAAPEDVLTVEQSFYTGKTATEQTLDSRVLSRVQSGRNVLAIRFNETSPDTGTLADFFSTTSTASMPYYRLFRLKLENRAQLNASHAFETLAPGATIRVNAYVYAQSGSWLIVPGNFFDDTMTNTNTAYVAKNDLDHNGVLSRAERVASYRFHRANYSLQFTGAICEGRTAPVFTDGAVKGLVADWMDKWTTISIGAANWNADGTYKDINFKKGNIGNVRYVFDDSLARGLLDDDEGVFLPVEAGFVAEK